MNLLRFIFAGLLMTSASVVYGMQAPALQQEFFDTKTAHSIIIKEINLDNLSDDWWNAAQEFAILFHERKPEEVCEANTKLRASFGQLKYRFEHAGQEGLDPKGFSLPASKEDCLFSVIYDGDAIIGFGILELVDTRVTSCYTLVNYKDYDPVIMLSEFNKLLKKKYPEAKSFVKSAPKSSKTFHSLLVHLGFKQVTNELDHCIRGDRREDSIVFELEF